jgi:hypothetical protein
VKTLLPALALFGAGCASLPPPHGDPVPPQPPVHEGECNAAPAQGLVGQTVSAVLNEHAMHLSGARVTRTLRPGQIVTMEYRADRLNIRIDTQGKVLAITCG